MTDNQLPSCARRRASAVARIVATATCRSLPRWQRVGALACGLALAVVAPSASAQSTTANTARNGDYIVAVVNQELVTAGEVQQRLDRIRAEAARSQATLPPAPALRQQVVNALIEERVQITNARESGVKLDEAEVDRAVSSVALQNQLTLPQLRQKLRQDGLDYAKFRANLRDQIRKERLPKRRLVIRDLLRLEYRNLYYSTDKPDSHTLRVRNRIETLWPINRHKITDDGTVYLSADWEWFIPADDPSERYANRQRIRAGAGYRRSAAWSFEALYVWDRSRNTVDEPFTATDHAAELTMKRVW